MGEVGCLFDEIGNLVDPTERRYMDVPAGPQRGMDAEASRPEQPRPTKNFCRSAGVNASRHAREEEQNAGGGKYAAD